MTLSSNEKGLILCIRRIKEHWKLGPGDDISYFIDQASDYADHVEERERADWVDADEGK